MSKVIVVGAGASGMLASLSASLNNEVILLDGNDKCGKKILVTGNGRCNYWNEDINISKYYTDDTNALENIISSQNQNEVMEYLTRLGIYPKIKNGYYYPNSNMASSVREILLRELKNRKVKIVNNFKVKDISYNNNEFIVKSNTNEILKSDKVILATGSYAASKTGCDGSGYKFAKNFGHTINLVTPALAPLIVNEKFLKDLKGVRVDVKLSLYVNKIKIKEEIGELQLTDSGISGICTFNVSSIASKNLNLGNSVEVKINFLPYIDSNVYDWMCKRNKLVKNHTISELLESVINYKLANVILKRAKINPQYKFDELTNVEKLTLCNMIEEFSLKIDDVASFDKAQVCTGGVSLKEINYNTMESSIITNLYIVGEVLDVDGICGGYNLAFAFISGYLAGKGC